MPQPTVPPRLSAAIGLADVDARVKVIEHGQHYVSVVIGTTTTVSISGPRGDVEQVIDLAARALAVLRSPDRTSDVVDLSDRRRGEDDTSTGEVTR